MRELADKNWEAHIPVELKLSAGAQEALANLPPGTRAAVPTHLPSRQRTLLVEETAESQRMYASAVGNDAGARGGRGWAALSPRP